MLLMAPDDPRVSRATGVCRKIVCTFPMGGKRGEILLSSNRNMDYHSTPSSQTAVQGGDGSKKLSRGYWNKRQLFDTVIFGLDHKY